LREALAAVPASDRQPMLEDLEEHLAEVAAESARPLTERLGDPAAYAAELWAAYGGRAPRGRRFFRRGIVTAVALVVGILVLGALASFVLNNPGFVLLFLLLLSSAVLVAAGLVAAVALGLSRMRRAPRSRG
ncbi:MAG: DUF1700 domain-containing protein, partial [Candidatus Dormibacteraeota bacterium]|nr:DUF1700 domain-containing protein [Candidatus Dormibacteraeota bacterium]